MSAPRTVRSRKDQPPTPRPRPRKDGTIGFQVRYRVPRPGSPAPVATSQVFDDIESATRWAELLHRVGPVAAEGILAAQLGAGTSQVPTLVECCRHYVDKLVLQSDFVICCVTIWLAADTRWWGSAGVGWLAVSANRRSEYAVHRVLGCVEEWGAEQA